MNERIRNETELIQTYLAPLAVGEPGTLGLKDDAAFFTPPAGTDLVVTTDPIIAGVHFFADQRADDIAWKALAVNISDLAAKGAVPLGYTLALAFPQAPERAWMETFAAGLKAAQDAFGCTLLGGDTDRTPGPLSIGVTAFGTVPCRHMVRRQGAAIGDRLYVTGTLGDAALGLALYRDAALHEKDLSSGDRGFLIARYLRPNPRAGVAPLLQRHASAALDISDGLAKDAARLARFAGGRAVIPYDHIPLSTSGALMIGADAARRQAVLAGGDDYEVLFCVPESRCAAFEAEAAGLPFLITQIGAIDEGTGVEIRDADGRALEVADGGYDHFAKQL